MKPQNLSIESELFSELRMKFDFMLALAMDKMQKMNVSKSKVTAVVEIETTAHEEAGEMVQLPDFKCEVRINLPAKGAIPAATPKGLKVTKSPLDGKYIIASDNYDLLDMVEEMRENDGGEN